MTPKEKENLIYKEESYAIHRRGNMNQPIFVFEIFASFSVFRGK